ncbi:MAG: hypothetical protein JWL78_306 [Chloroflexi bacterium]|jgi:hypothetical protein|nr:hypothetical protein [Chloroflexota bacterium]MEA2616016.1 hypothetical protein [Chloroflexota bacterium]
MSPADLLDRAPAGPDQLAVRVVERAVEELLRRRPRTEGDELLALDAVARAAARLAAERRPERRVPESDGPVPMAGWWSFAAQFPEVAL